MQFERTGIPDVMLVRPRVFGDARGFFFESWEERKFAEAGCNAKFVQDNHSRSVQFTLRGLHYQIEHTQGKLVRVVTGTVFDVAVDIRRGSPTFGQHVSVTLSDENHHLLWIPPGFAHGFLVLTDFADVVYRCTDFYSPTHERAIIWSDPHLNIKWPLAAGEEPILSAKDAAAVQFRDAEYFS